MSRLTTPGFDYDRNFVASNLQSWPIAQALKRLATYEDIGLEPEQILALANGKLADASVDVGTDLYLLALGKVFEKTYGATLEHVCNLLAAEKGGKVVVMDEKTALSVSAGARAILNNKRLQCATYMWDIFGECGGPKEIGYIDAAIRLREMSEPVLAPETARIEEAPNAET